MGLTRPRDRQGQVGRGRFGLKGNGLHMAPKVCNDYNDGAHTWCEINHGWADRSYRKWMKLRVFHAGFAGFHWPHSIRRPIIGWWTGNRYYPKECWSRHDRWEFL